MPIIIRHAISGRVLINSEDPVFEENPAVPMLLDIFSERGYQASVDIHRIEVPESFDLHTGQIRCRLKKVYRFTVTFKGTLIRRG